MNVLKKSACLAVALLLAQSSLPASPNTDVARQLNAAFVEVADKISPSVVVITVTESRDFEPGIGVG